MTQKSEEEEEEVARTPRNQIMEKIKITWKREFKAIFGKVKIHAKKYLKGVQ